MSTLDKLNDIFRMVFDDEALHITPQTTANDIDGWDSLSHINLIIAVEKEFKIKFRQQELLSYKNVGDLVNGIDSKLK